MEQTADEVEQFGIHLMIDGYGAPAYVLSDKEQLTNLLHQLPAALHMHAICDPVVVEVGPKNHKDPGGISGFVMIAESHISFHTFPNRGFVTIDVYTCQNELDTDLVTQLLQQAFSFTDLDVYIQPRGLRYPSANVQ